MSFRSRISTLSRNLKSPCTLLPQTRTFSILPRPATFRTQVQPPRTSLSRSLQSTPPNSARYERFDKSSSGSNFRVSPGGPPIMTFLRRRLGGDRAIWLYGIGLGGAGIYYVVHLERVPETGRLRFIDVSEAQERELGLQTQLQTLKEYDRALLPANHAITKRVRKIAQRIVESSNLGRMKSGGEMSTIEGSVRQFGGGGGDMNDVSMGEMLFGGGGGGGSTGGRAQLDEGKDTEWEVYVINDKNTKNAFVLPGGKIFVFTGILPVSANDDGLATVLGHEVAHQVARHPAERMSYMKVLFGLGFLLESFGLDVGVTRLILTLMLQLPNSRKSESEADFIGLRLMARACFNPHESVDMWRRMSESEQSGMTPPAFLSTHPPNVRRIKQLTKWIPEADEIRASSSCGTTSNQLGGFLDSLGPSNSGRPSEMW